MRLSIANGFGNVDVRGHLPRSYTHVSGKNLQPLCRKLGIKFAPALVGFGTPRKDYPARPVLDGVVISARSAPKLLKAVAERAARNPPEKRAARAVASKKYQEAKRRQLNAKLFKLGLTPGTWSAKLYLQGELDQYSAALMAFKAEFRHQHTNYDELLHSGYERDEAREIRDERPIPSQWGDYLGNYGFHGAIAEALTKILKDPTKCHPIWFYEAVLAIERAIDAGHKIEVKSLTHKKIKGMIDDWRKHRVWDDAGYR